MGGVLYRVPKGTFRIGAVAIEPVPAVPWIHPGSVAMAVLALASLRAGRPGEI
jgi:hypothetical protein